VTTDKEYAATLQEYRRHLQGALRDASRDYEQAVLVVSAGTLAVSVTFARDITPTPVPGSTGGLVVAWLLLGLAMLATVLSFVTSQREIWNQTAAIDDGKEVKLTWLARATWLLNLVGGVALAGGLILLGAYALTNMTSPSVAA